MFVLMHEYGAYCTTPGFSGASWSRDIIDAYKFTATEMTALRRKWTFGPNFRFFWIGP